MTPQQPVGPGDDGGHVASADASVRHPGKRGGATSGPWRELGIFAVLLILYALLAIREPSFRGWVNLRNVLTQISMVAILAVGMTGVIITGGIDLSVGSVAAVCACAAGVLMAQHGCGGGVGILVTLALGTCIGLFNGFSVSKVGLPPFIATLAVMVMARGLAFVISGGGAIYRIPESYLWPGAGDLFRGVPLVQKLPAMIGLMLAFYAAGQLVLQRTRLGRYLYSVGGSEEATRLSGVPVARVKLVAYAFCGFLAGLVGMLFTGYVGAAEPTIGDGLELDVIAAVVIGGTSLSGGQGNLPGTFAGALLIGLVRNGLNLMQVDSNYQKVAIGAIIYLAVMLDTWQKKRRRS
jgi:ribose transport system permease protein